MLSDGSLTASHVYKSSDDPGEHHVVLSLPSRYSSKLLPGRQILRKTQFHRRTLWWTTPVLSLFLFSVLLSLSLSFHLEKCIKAGIETRNNMMDITTVPI